MLTATWLFVSHMLVWVFLISLDFQTQQCLQFIQNGAIKHAASNNFAGRSGYLTYCQLKTVWAFHFDLFLTVSLIFFSDLWFELYQKLLTYICMSLCTVVLLHDWWIIAWMINFTCRRHMVLLFIVHYQSNIFEHLIF